MLEIAALAHLSLSASGTLITPQNEWFLISLAVPPFLCLPQDPRQSWNVWFPATWPVCPPLCSHLATCWLSQSWKTEVREWGTWDGERSKVRKDVLTSRGHSVSHQCPCPIVWRVPAGCGLPCTVSCASAQTSVLLQLWKGQSGGTPARDGHGTDSGAPDGPPGSSGEQRAGEVCSGAQATPHIFYNPVLHLALQLALKKLSSGSWIHFQVHTCTHTCVPLFLMAGFLTECQSGPANRLSENNAGFCPHFTVWTQRNVKWSSLKTRKGLTSKAAHLKLLCTHESPVVLVKLQSWFRRSGVGPGVLCF